MSLVSNVFILFVIVSVAVVLFFAKAFSLVGVACK